MRHWKTGTKGTLPADGREKERQRLQCFLFAPEDFSDPGAVFIVICPCPSRRYVLFPSTDATKRTERSYYTSDITAPLFYLSIWSHFLSVILCCQRCHNYNKTFCIGNEIMTKNTSFILLHSQLHLFLRAVGGAREEYYIVLYTLITVFFKVKNWKKKKNIISDSSTPGSICRTACAAVVCVENVFVCACNVGSVCSCRSVSSNFTSISWT